MMFICDKINLPHDDDDDDDDAPSRAQCILAIYRDKQRLFG